MGYPSMIQHKYIHSKTYTWGRETALVLLFFFSQLKKSFRQSIEPVQNYSDTLNVYHHVPKSMCCFTYHHTASPYLYTS